MKSKMLATTCFLLSTIFPLASGNIQNPPLTQCSGVDEPVIKVENVTIKDAELGKTVKMDATVLVSEEFGTSPVLYISYASSNGTNLPCIEAILPCQLKLCNGTTKAEKRLNEDWNNECPIQPGSYKAHLQYRLPNDPAIVGRFGDGNVVITLKVADNDTVVECVSFPVTVDLD